MRTCKKCGETKQDVEFNKGQSRCITCQREYNREYYLKNREAEKERSLQYYHENRDRRLGYMRDYYAENRERENSRSLAWVEGNRERFREQRKLYYKNNKEKLDARSAVAKATKNGEIPKVTECECELCGEQATEYHHYAGYNQDDWLSVIPLCSGCHGIVHRVA